MLNTHTVCFGLSHSSNVVLSSTSLRSQHPLFGFFEGVNRGQTCFLRCSIRPTCSRHLQLTWKSDGDIEERAAAQRRLKATRQRWAFSAPSWRQTVPQQLFSSSSFILFFFYSLQQSSKPVEKGNNETITH